MKWLPDNDTYRNAVQNADYKTFKRNPAYAAIVGNDTRGYGTTKQFYDYVKHIPYYPENDQWGNPVLHEIEGQKVSCGTLRYMKVKQDLSLWTFNSIVEIGGGYGGQRLIFKEIKDYTIIDLPEVNDLIGGYLALNGSNATLIDSDRVGTVFADLCISDYALSEFDEELIDLYLDRVIKNCKYGYFTVNMNFKLLEEKLLKYFYLRIVPEEPKTSKHDNMIYYAYRR